MRRGLGLLAGLLLVTAPLAAQDLSIEEPPAVDEPSAAAQPDVTSAPGAMLRVLDKINGTLTDLDIVNGETGAAGSLTVTVAECRYPTDNPSGDAYALVSIRTVQDETALFEGWLIASSPALNAMDHPRYDVWLLRCIGT